MHGLDLCINSPANKKPTKEANILATPKTGDIYPKLDDCHDVLTTPILLSPKYHDMWSASARRILTASSSPEDLSSSNPGSEDIKNIGLCSPCDGALAKRRKHRQGNSTDNSSATDSSPCDSPQSQTSPRDLTLKTKDEVKKIEESKLKIKREAEGSLRLNSGKNYTQIEKVIKSPLMVPSPNWAAVDKYIDQVKTPKVLESGDFFDLLSPSASLIKNRSRFTSLKTEKSPAINASGASFILSPTDSPRFPIPETPKDLSNKSSTNRQQDKIPPLIKVSAVERETAEDLSTRFQNNETTQDLQMKCETRMDTSYRQGGSYDDFKYIDGKVNSHFYVLPQLEQQSNFQTSSNDSSSSCNEVPTLNNGYVDPLHNYDSSYMPNVWNFYGYGVNRTDPSHFQQLTFQENNEHHSKSSSYSGYYSIPNKALMTSDYERRYQRKEKANHDDMTKKHKLPTKMRKDSGDDVKTSYKCHICYRSYKWNYNLNRHLKYECGKENAFQCGKCGRKFPHKQNCVYHLKRKHKIIYETVEEYLEMRLVLFNGSVGVAEQEAQSVKKFTN